MKSNINFIFCSFVPVGLEDYVEYFRKHFKRFTYLKWRFQYIDPKKVCSSMQNYVDGGLIEEKKMLSLPNVNKKYLYFSQLPLAHLIYLFQALKNLIKLRKAKETIIFMGVNYFCAFCGVLLKKIKMVNIVIYRVTDFFPLPRKGFYRILNRVFYAIDKVCLNNSDIIWFTTIGHIEGREKYNYFDRTKYVYEIIPLGMNLDNFVSLPLSEIKEHSLVYCGIISKYHMLGMLFDTINKLKIKYHGIQLSIIGSGPDEEYFRSLANSMGLIENIHFYGFVKDSKIFTEIISKSQLGVALYNDEEDFIKYTEPAKVKTYLNYGVPVIVSDVPKIAKEIAENRVGYCIKNNISELYNAIDAFWGNKNEQTAYRNNIVNYVRNFDVEKLLGTAFMNTFQKLGLKYE